MAISMGGLDARRAIQKCELGDRLISLTTVATPHRGTPLADSIAKDEPSSGLFKELGDSLKDLRTSACATFNDNVTDDERVQYYSIGFMIEEPVTLQNTDFLTWYLHLSIKNKSGESNDGLVGTGSAEWGTYLGTMMGNHLAISVANQEYRGEKIYQATYQAVVDNLVSVDSGASE
jgi:triacylglycerol lipase